MAKIQRNKLNPKTVASLSKPGKYSDGAGLLLRIDQQGRRNWIQRVHIQGRETMRGLGTYPEVSLAQARNAAAELRERVRNEPPPETQPDYPTFAEITPLFLGGWRGQFRNAKHAAQWQSTLETYCYPVIGDMPVADITTGDVLGVLAPIWEGKNETATRLRQRMEKIFDWAILHNYRERVNPAGRHILVGLPKVKRQKKHMRSLPYGEVPSALHAVQLSTARPLTRLAFRFLVLTAARSGEVRLAEWSEIDWEERVWTVPAERMKAGREHRVPLSDQAMDALCDARGVVYTGKRRQAEGAGTRAHGLIFPTGVATPMSDVVFSVLLKRLGIDGVPHGFRSSFRDWCAETGVARDLAESSLAHVLGASAVESAYLRTDLLDQRRGLMQQWADFCTTSEGRWGHTQ